MKNYFLFMNFSPVKLSFPHGGGTGVRRKNRLSIVSNLLVAMIFFSTMRWRLLILFTIREEDGVATANSELIDLLNSEGGIYYFSVKTAKSVAYKKLIVAR